MKDPNVRQETIKILGENTGKDLFDLGCSNVILEARETKAKINYWDFIFKSLCTAKVTINKTKRQPTKWGMVFGCDISDKGLDPKYIKNL